METVTDHEKSVLAIARSISEIMRRGCAVSDNVEGLLMEIGDSPHRPVGERQREELAQKLADIKELAPDIRDPEVLSALSNKDVSALLAARHQPAQDDVRRGCDHGCASASSHTNREPNKVLGDCASMPLIKRRACCFQLSNRAIRASRSVASQTRFRDWEPTGRSIPAFSN